MSFSRVKPGNWAVGEELTSAQMNTLDTDHANAVDKTGDTISAGLIIVNSGGKIRGDLHDTIVSNATAAISTVVSRGISIGHDQGLSMDTANAWPYFPTPRSFYRMIDPRPHLGVSNWTMPAANLIGGGASAGFPANIFFTPHHGSTLTSVDVIFAVGTSHASVPAILPSVAVYRVKNADISLVGAAPVADDPLYSGTSALFTPTPATGAAWYNSGNKQTWSVTCDQNNVIDRTKYRYYIQLVDENGANSAAGNIYYGFRANYTAISNMQFA